MQERPGEGEGLPVLHQRHARPPRRGADDGVHALHVRLRPRPDPQGREGGAADSHRHRQLLAGAAHEAGRVPARVRHRGQPAPARVLGRHLFGFVVLLKLI